MDAKTTNNESHSQPRFPARCVTIAKNAMSMSWTNARNNYFENLGFPDMVVCDPMGEFVDAASN